VEKAEGLKWQLGHRQEAGANIQLRDDRCLKLDKRSRRRMEPQASVGVKSPLWWWVKEWREESRIPQGSGLDKWVHGAWVY
jgi:hypothetical protein